MNIGKGIALGFGVVIVFLMGYLLMSGDAQPEAKVAAQKTQNQPEKKAVNNNDLATDAAELNKILELKQSLENTNDGVSKLYLTSCAPCHAKDGKGVIAPSIAGKNKEEILARLHDYKANLVPNTLMKGVLDNVSDENLTALAEEISLFK
ncbi:MULTISPECIES: c-type cytochrome [Campylobacter]|uniref:Cytochrome c domain-containing protein n=3 Tax=Campylobacter fetus TaxID=196 RepID=Q841W0_CAMFE|nr:MULTISPECIES: c-type cytochrome [Campylobacter]AAO64242.1 hypothetical protein Cf0041 [Campylobacter fetus]ABK82174.1 conserved hypothetical protein [Campylobacter fetus subsp. fetus 82-40]AHE93787.1 monoheme c-type cytochrome [Campylobacter fetus subsp. venerealis cfvi03/293]AIR78389.1 monoheme c-type cytochrome [Campylobacter fetus subsp. fetus 04/554]AIR80111.1 monoheme c-type cytochrome [Campylobacter fetus subsp. venerealis 97/608]